MTGVPIGLSVSLFSEATTNHRRPLVVSGYSTMTSMDGNMKRAEEKYAEGRMNENQSKRTLVPHDRKRKREPMKRMLCLTIIMAVLIHLMALCWRLRSIIVPATDITVPTAPSHFHMTLPVSEENRRHEYVNNTFVQMLHQHQLIMNTTECWVCGLFPTSAAGQIPFIPSPFSCPGSTSTWYAVLKTAYFRRPTTKTKNSLVRSIRDPTMTQAMTDLRRTCVSAMTEATSEESKAYEQRNQSYYISYFTGRRRNHSHAIQVLSQRAPHCVRGAGRIRVGDSDCDKMTALNDSQPLALVASERTYFICGTNGYTWLPANWSGTCYIAFLLPPTFTASPDFHNRHYPRRIKRGVLNAKDTAGQEAEDFATGVFPLWGPMVNSRHIRQLTRVVETTIDITAGALSNITAELQADRLMTLQNRIVLDIILADRGGVCTLIGSSCCVYIPDDAPTVYQAIKRLHIIDKSMHLQEGTWSLAGWTWSIITAWGWRIIMIVSGALTVVFACCLCLQCLPAICGACVTPCIPKRSNAKREEDLMMLQQETDRIMDIDPN